MYKIAHILLVASFFSLSVCVGGYILYIPKPILRNIDVWLRGSGVMLSE